MQYTCVENVTVKTGQMDEALRKAETELLPLYRNLPGFVAYTVAKTDETSFIGLSIWKTQAQAEHAVVAQEDWMKKGTGQLIDSFHHTGGSLPFLAFTSDLVAYASAVSAAAGQRA
jgi:heme-degrading monooxygenase HmoA